MESEKKELPHELAETVLRQKESMRKLASLFESRLSSGLLHGTIVSQELCLETFFNPDNQYLLIKEGSRVVMVETSVFFEEKYRNLEGFVIEMEPADEKGYILVEFADGSKKPCRFGHPEVEKGISDIICLDYDLPAMAKDEQTFTVSVEGRIFQMSNILNLGLELGDVALINPNNNCIVGRLTNYMAPGYKGLVSSISGNQIEVSIEGQNRLVWMDTSLISLCNRGDEVSIDTSMLFAFAVLTKKARSINPTTVGKIGLNEVIGLDEAKEEIKDHINEAQLSELYESATAGTIHSNVNAKGMLLSGPPGNGKTLLIKAAAKEFGLVVLTMPSTEALQKYVGDGPALIRSYRYEAERIYKETKTPVIVFIDEIDAIARKRSSDSNQEYLNSLTIALLTTIDGTEVSSGILWVGATNREELLDPAVVRAGRLSRKVFVGRPQEKDIPKFFGLYFHGVKIDSDENQDLVDYATKRFLSKKNVIYELSYIKEGVELQKSLNPSEDDLEKKYLLLSHAASGSMLADIVSMAMRKALRRDVQNRNKIFSGIRKEDVDWAVFETYQGVLSIDLDDVIKDFVVQETRTPYKEVSYRKK